MNIHTGLFFLLLATNGGFNKFATVASAGIDDLFGKPDYMPSILFGSGIESLVLFYGVWATMPVIAIGLHNQHSIFKNKIRLPSVEHGFMHDERKAALYKFVMQRLFNASHFDWKVLLKASLPYFFARSFPKFTFSSGACQLNFSFRSMQRGALPNAFGKNVAGFLVCPHKGGSALSTAKYTSFYAALCARQFLAAKFTMIRCSAVFKTIGRTTFQRAKTCRAGKVSFNKDLPTLKARLSFASVAYFGIATTRAKYLPTLAARFIFVHRFYPFSSAKCRTIVPHSEMKREYFNVAAPTLFDLLEASNGD